MLPTYLDTDFPRGLNQGSSTHGPQYRDELMWELGRTVRASNSFSPALQDCRDVGVMNPGYPGTQGGLHPPPGRPHFPGSGVPRQHQRTGSVSVPHGKPAPSSPYAQVGYSNHAYHWIAASQAFVNGIEPLPLTRLACLAYGKTAHTPDFALEVESGYLPKHLVQGSWHGEFPI